MSSTLAQSIRRARLAAGLTQNQLGMRMGLKGRAVSRWERDDSAPKKRYRGALVAVIRAVNTTAADELVRALAIAEGKGVMPSPAAVAAAPVAAPPNGAAALELALFRMADELDLPPRRLRGPLLRLLERLRAGNLTLESAKEHLEHWIADA
jgi:transcriptional regulator with XRE-family HTH domain